MFIKQVSVFIENVPGKLSEVTKILGENGVDISALTLADTTDFGILRLIVNDPDKACAALREHSFIVKLSDVVAVVIDDKPGGLTAVLDILGSAQVSVEYLYAFVGSQDGHAVVVLRPDDALAAVKALEENRVSTLEPKDIYRI
ncbi:MAG: acetolactate synthase [Evtepia sp.]|uniref:acetolactate synthase n=1 Tax=Evtepia sp. TaxID=2773933 RepID=UPI002986F489|nr:acetolactate synthase [Evtepia sp.]MDD7289697.1 acetolactate synthase [Clostridiales bacterium]MDY4431414.1 acetolactate synthase [Evtepia sp.]